MFIEKIVLENFRIYRGINVLSFTPHPQQNISVVAGNNGYGKTTLLTSLLWCLYGKLIADVDERHRREIYEAGGYRHYCRGILNYSLAYNKGLQSELQAMHQESLFLEGPVAQQLNPDAVFSVTLNISNLTIPSLPCNSVEVKRVYDCATDLEKVSILIDGRENELTREVGPEIFIHDFILPKEIAKFFFFDAEKIVSLAEMTSIEEKKALSAAYSEVLGIKKYEDLKRNLENVRTRLRKDYASIADRTKLNSLISELDENTRLISYYKEKELGIEEELVTKKREQDKYQEKLIREGSTISLEELSELKTMKAHLGKEAQDAKQDLNEFLELAPLAIAANKFKQVIEQIEKEDEFKGLELSNNAIDRKLTVIKEEILGCKKDLALTKTAEQKIFEILNNHLGLKDNVKLKSLLDFSPQESNEIRSLWDNIVNSYSGRFKEAKKRYKSNQSAYLGLINKLKAAETKEKDVVIKEIRKEKSKVEHEIHLLEKELIEVKALMINLVKENNNILKITSELTKKVEVENLDRKKDEVTSRLIQEITEFTQKLKVNRRLSLESKILKGLHTLMHKTSIIDKVVILMEGELIDIELLGKNGQKINKNNLSKGEQQLYATAILKALVEESNIHFPVFIDSPLQKFDKDHAENIINDFYPYISEQVVLFPLLGKELNEQEYSLLLPKISETYLIDHTIEGNSEFKSILPKDLFKVHSEIDEYVH